MVIRVLASLSCTMKVSQQNMNRNGFVSNEQVVYGFMFYLKDVCNISPSYTQRAEDVEQHVVDYENTLRKFWKGLMTEQMKRDPYNGNLEWAFYYAINDVSGPLHDVWNQYRKVCGLEKSVAEVFKRSDTAVDHSNLRRDFFRWLRTVQISTASFLVPMIPYVNVEKDGMSLDFRTVLLQFFTHENDDDDDDEDDNDEVKIFQQGSVDLKRTQTLIEMYAKSLAEALRRDEEDQLIRDDDDDDNNKIYWGLPLPFIYGFQERLRIITSEARSRKVIAEERRMEEDFVLRIMQKLNTKLRNVLEHKEKLSRLALTYNTALDGATISHTMQVEMFVMVLTSDDYDGSLMRGYMSSEFGSGRNGRMLMGVLKGRSLAIANRLQNIGNVTIYVKRTFRNTTPINSDVDHTGRYESHPYSLWMIMRDGIGAQSTL